MYSIFLSFSKGRRRRKKKKSNPRHESSVQLPRTFLFHLLSVPAIFPLVLHRSLPIYHIEQSKREKNPQRRGCKIKKQIKVIKNFTNGGHANPQPTQIRHGRHADIDDEHGCPGASPEPCSPPDLCPSR